MNKCISQKEKNIISKCEYDRIVHDLHQNIHGFLNEVKGHVEAIKMDIKHLEAINLVNEIDTLIEEAYQRILSLKLGE